jgi:hypothetical protein
VSSASSDRLTEFTNPPSFGDNQVAFTSGPNTSTISFSGTTLRIQVLGFT